MVNTMGLPASNAIPGMPWMRSGPCIEEKMGQAKEGWKQSAALQQPQQFSLAKSYAAPSSQEDLIPG